MLQLFKTYWWRKNFFSFFPLRLCVFFSSTRSQRSVQRRLGTLGMKVRVLIELRVNVASLKEKIWHHSFSENLQTPKETNRSLLTCSLSSPGDMMQRLRHFYLFTFTLVSRADSDWHNGRTGSTLCSREGEVQISGLPNQPREQWHL